MTADRKKKPGTRSETASTIRDTAGGLIGKAKAAVTSKTDAFAAHAMAATLYEIKAAEIALRRSRREDIKQFAQKMIEDHGKVKSELGSFLGATEGPTSPPDEIDKLHRILIDDLNGASDADFDERYIEQQKIAHSETITLFEAYLEHGQHSGLQNLCRLGLPVLEEHARMARELEDASS